MSPVPRIAAMASHLRVGEGVLRSSGCIARILVHSVPPGRQDGVPGPAVSLQHEPLPALRRGSADVEMKGFGDLGCPPVGPGTDAGIVPASQVNLQAVVLRNQWNGELDDPAVETCVPLTIHAD